MNNKKIGVLLILLSVMIISITAVSAADTNGTLLQEVSDTDITTASLAVEQKDNATSLGSEAGSDVEISVNDNREEISSHKVESASSNSKEILSASNDDVLKASSDCFYWDENNEWFEDLRDAMDHIKNSDSKIGTIYVKGGTYTELDRTTCGDIYIHFTDAATITIQPYNKGDTVIFDGSVAVNNYLFWLDHKDLKVTFTNITFKKGHATASGGAIEVAKGQVTLNNCILTENEALDYGGAVSVADAGTFIANNCSFINNWAEDDGGAISCEDDGTVQLNNCYFEGNKKIKDGVEEDNDFGYEDSASNPGEWIFNDCQFKGHGSLEIEVDAPNKSVTITPSVTDDVNIVVLYKDGYYYREESVAILPYAEFNGLDEGTYTVYLIKDPDKKYIYPDNTFPIIEPYFVLDDKDVFENLTAAVNAIRDGGSGVITVEGGTYTESANFNVQIRNKVVTIRPKLISEYEDTVTFSANSQSYLLDVGPNAQLILEDIVITGKFSNAALIFTSDLESSITDCEFNNIKNSQNQPGTPISAQNSKLELNGTNFDLNGQIILENTVATIDECIFTNNAGEHGGAINADSSSDLTVTSSHFICNNATTEGGAIYATNLKVEGSEFILNVAELGGAVYITDKGDSLVNITSSVFDSNVATNSRNIYSASPTRKFNLEFNEYDLNLSMNKKDASYGADYILTGVFDWGSNLNNTETLLSGTMDEDNYFLEVLPVEDNKFNINLGVLSGGTHELSMIGMFTQGDSVDHFYNDMYYSDLNGNEFYLTNPAYLKVVIEKGKILLNLEVKNVLIPEIPVLNLYANWDNNYTIFIGNKYYQLEVVNGKGSMQLTGLDLGNHSVVAMRDADENFDLAINFTTFSISKTYSNFLVISTNVEYDTLAEAVANSGNEDTIYVKNGTYKDTKVVISNKTLDIIALETVVFDAQGADANFIIVNENAEVYIHGITFRGIQNRNTNYGAIVNHGYLSLDSCNFTDNKITKTSFAGNGGAAIFSDGESLEIDDCYFINNVAPLKVSTAAVTSVGYEDISITDSKFINNTAREGGAVHFKNISQFESAIISCEFEHNTAVKGSAIYIGNNSRYASVILSNFVKNNIKNSLGEKAQLEGGAIYVNANTTEVTVDIGLSNFENNSNADVDGGAICFDGISNAYIDSCVFNNNSGKLGSAILIKNPYNKKITLFVDGSAFTNNHATTGAVATSPKVTALFDECVFLNNTGENRHIYSNGFTVAHDTVFEVVDANLKASTVSYGNNSVIKGTADIGANIYAVANLTVAGENVTAEVKDNKFSYDAGVLNHGKYTAVLNNIVDMNDNIYVMDSITVTFKVNRVGIELNVSVDNITYGETLKVVETLPSTALGTISYQLNGKSYTKDELESLKLDAGKYALVASYNNEDFAPSSSVINFEVYKANPTISVEDVEVKDNGTVVVNIKTNVPSIYTIEIGDYKTDKYVNGSRSVEIDKIFEPGTYTIKVTSQERVNYKSNYTEATLTVTKTLGVFTLGASNKVTSPNKAIIGVSAPENAVGNITYTITDSNKNVVKTLTQSCRDDLIVSDLDAGDYEINAVFEGDDLYYSTSNIKMAPLSIMRAANNEDIRTSGEDDYIDDEYYNLPFIYQEDEDSDYYEYYETLEKAIDAASLMGGIITVRGGTYKWEDGNAGIDIEGELEITIRAFEGEEVIFDCQHESDFLYLSYDTEVEIIETVPPIPIIYTTEGPTITLENLTVINGYAVSDGAVIEMDAGSLTLLNCNFYNNDAEYGGVIYIGSLSSDQDADVIAFNCTFINNTARSEGGAIYISEGLEQFVSASFVGCTFLDNYQGEGDERTMNYFAGDAVEEIVKKACIFNAKDTVTWSKDNINQTVTVIGTSTDVFDSIVLLYFDQIPLYSIYNNGSQKFNVTFEDVMGGNYTIGIMNDHDLNTYIFKDASFEMIVPNFIISADKVYENLTDAIKAVEKNGIIYANANYHIDENMEIVFNNCNNSFTLTNFRDRMVVFDGNSTNWFFTVPEGYNVVIENIEFVDGGIKDYASIENYGSLTLKNCTFTGFETDTIIYNYGSLNITEGVFSLNSINNAIVLNDGELFIDGVEFSSNVINTNSVVYNNGNAEIVASNFTENINNGNGGVIYNKKKLSINGTVFNENEGKDGGVVYNEGTLEVLNSDFEDNTANGYGGAIFNNGEANIDNSSFSGSFSAKDGAAIYNNNTMVVNNSTLVANTATENGGAIYNNKTLKLTDSFFGINFAYEYANIYNAGDIQSFSGNTFDFYDVILYVPDGEYGIPTTITGTLDPQLNMDLQLILPGFVNNEDAQVAITDGIFEYNTDVLPKGAYDVILAEIIHDTNGNIYIGESIRDRLIVNKANVYINLTVEDIILKNSETPVLKISASKNGTFQLLFNNKLSNFTIAGTQAEIDLVSVGEGNYSVMVFRGGDENYNDAVNTTTFTVSEYLGNFIVNSSGGKFDTLNEAISNSAAEDIIYVMEGNYTGFENLGVNILKNLTITALGEVVFDANSISGQVLYAGSMCDVTLEGIIFTGYTGIIIQNSGNLTLDGCTFVNNTFISEDSQDYGSIYNENNLNIVGSEFYDNILSGQSLIFSKSKQSNITINESIFENNALSGISRIIDIVYANSVNVISTEFSENTLESGSIIHVRHCNDVLISSDFYNNTNTQGEQVIFAWNNTNLNIENSTFIGNIMPYGYIICSDENNQSIISECTFTDNTVKNVVFIEDDDILLISESTFSANTIKADGAIYIKSMTDTTVDGCVFADNKADNYRNIYRVIADLNITNSVFDAINVDYSVNGIDYKQNETIEGTIDIGINIPFTVNLNINNKVYPVKVTNNKFTYTLSNLTGGEYEVVLNPEDNNSNTFVFDKITKTFAVNRIDPGLKVTISNITQGEKLEVNATLINNATDKILYQLNGKWYDKAQLENLLLTHGNYLVAAAYSGNKNYYPVAIPVNVEVYKITPNITVSDAEANYGEDIKINADVDVADYYTVFLDDIYDESVSLYIDGSGTFSVPSKNFKPGKYEIKVYKIETDDYNEAYGYANLILNKVIGVFNLSNDTITYGENATISVEIPVNAYGNITYIIYDENNEEVYTIKQSCMEELVVPNLNAGKYNVTGTFEADSYYTEDSKVTSSTIVVNTKGVDLNITVANITYGENAIVIVEADVDGEYRVYVGNNQFVVNVINGTGNVPVSNLNVGNHTVNATIIDGNYSAFNETVFGVVPKPVSVTVSVEDIVYGEDAIVFVYGEIDGEYVVEVNNQNYTVNVVGGKGNTSVSGLFVNEGILASVSIVDGNYSAVNTTAFNVVPKQVSVNISIENITFGDDAVVVVQADVDGNYIVTIRDENHNVTVSGGNGVISVPNLTVGNQIAATVKRNDNYTAFNETAFDIISKMTNVEVAVGDVTYGESAVVNVTAEIDGMYTLSVNGIEYPVEVIDGKASQVISGLAAGNYLVQIAIVDGNYSAFNQVEFNVTPKQVSLAVSVVNTTYEEDTVVIIESDLDGEYLVDVDGAVYSVNVVGGIGNVTVSNLTVGSHVVNVSVVDSNYSADYSTTFDIALIDTPISADVNVTENRVTVTVTVDSDATGIVKFEVTGAEEYTVYADVVNGKAVMDNVLEVGDYTVVATYMGDGRFNSNVTSESFTVKGHVKKDTPISANVDVDGYKVTVTVNVNENATGFVNMKFTDTEFNIELTDGVGSLTVDLPANSYNVDVTYLGDDNFNENMTKIIFTVVDPIKENTPISLDVSTVENYVTFTVTVDSDATGIVKFEVTGAKEYTVYADVLNGIAVMDDVLEVGDYTVVATYMGDDIFNSNNTFDSFVVEIKPVIISVASEFSDITIGDDLTIYVVLKDEYGNVIANAPINYMVNGTAGTTITDADGSFTVKAVSGAEVDIFYAGSEIFLPTNLTLTFNVPDVPVVVKTATYFDIPDRAITIYGYAVDGPADEQGIYYATTLLDANGNPVSNVYMEFAVNNKIYNRTTYENGSFRPYKLNMIRAGRYTMAFNFAGDDNYTNAFACVCVDLDKKPVTIKASAKSYKATTKIKKYTVALSTIKSLDGKMHLSPKYITLKVNGKTYTGKTNSKGQFTFKITNLKKTGKYTAKISYKGDKTYESATKSVKLTIK